ncbi:MAG: photosystem II biosynthesis protein [Cyanobium sp.]
MARRSKAGSASSGGAAGFQRPGKGQGFTSGVPTGRPAGGPSGKPSGSSAGRSRVIPEPVANRMARRIAIATGIPTLMGMGVFIASYVLVSRGILEIEPVVTLVATGACFLLGLAGLSYGVLASSWEDAPGSLLGLEQIGVNIGRIRTSLRAMRQGSGGSPS